MTTFLLMAPANSALLPKAHLRAHLRRGNHVRRSRLHVSPRGDPRSAPHQRFVAARIFSNLFGGGKNDKNDNDDSSDSKKLEENNELAEAGTTTTEQTKAEATADATTPPPPPPTPPKPPRPQLTPEEQEAKTRRTLSDLDAILGIDEEEERKKEEEKEAREEARLASKRPSSDTATTTTTSEKGAAEAGDGDDVQAVLNRIAERAREIGSEDSELSDTERKEGKERLREEFDTVLNMIRDDAKVSTQDVRVFRDKVFNQSTFWITGSEANEDIEGGHVFRGNLRGDRKEVFASVSAKTKEIFDDKFAVFLVEQRDIDDAFSPRGPEEEPRVAFLVVPRERAVPPPTQGWQYVASVFLLGLASVSAIQLGVVAQSAKVPREVLVFFSNPDNFASDVPLPDVVANFDPISLIAGALPIAGGVLAAQITGDITRRVVGSSKGVAIGAPFTLPNAQLGTFGILTRTKTLVDNRADYFDIHAAAWVASFGVSLGLFIYGLLVSVGADPSDIESYIPTPAVLFRSSLLLGTISSALLPATATASAASASAGASLVFVHPAFIAGWCGLTTCALTGLPVGSLDGGKAVGAAWGQAALAATSLFSYLGLGLGFLGSSLSLPYGLLVIFTSRTPERVIRDTVSPPDGDSRSTLTGFIVVFSILTLLPAALSGSGGDFGL